MYPHTFRGSPPLCRLLLIRQAARPKHVVSRSSLSLYNDRVSIFQIENNLIYTLELSQKFDIQLQNWITRTIQLSKLNNFGPYSGFKGGFIFF